MATYNRKGLRKVQVKFGVEFLEAISAAAIQLGLSRSRWIVECLNKVLMDGFRGKLFTQHLLQNLGCKRPTHIYMSEELWLKVADKAAELNISFTQFVSIAIMSEIQAVPRRIYLGGNS